MGSERLAKFGICATGFVCVLPHHRVYLQWRVYGRSPTGNSFLFASPQTLSATTTFLTSLSLEFEADQPSRAQINLLLRHGFRSSGEVWLLGDVYRRRDGLSCFTTASTLASAKYFEVWLFMGWPTPTFKQHNLRPRYPRHGQSSFTAGMVKVSQQRQASAGLDAGGMTTMPETSDQWNQARWQTSHLSSCTRLIGQRLGATSVELWSATHWPPDG